MLNLVKTIAQRVDKAKRLIKFLRMGLNDTQEVYQAAPFGTDSVPVKDLIAVYGATSVSGEAVIIGYLNKSCLAAVGEHRTYSTDEDGEVKFYIWLKNDGTCEIGGADDNMVRYSKLELAFNEEKAKLNDLVNKHNTLKDLFIAHVHPAPGGTTSAITPAPVLPNAEPSTADITPAKIEQIKTLAAT